MSRQLNMSLVNYSDRTILSYSVMHSWNGNNHMLNGQNLSNGSESHSVQITSGYTQYDWYTVQLNLDGLGYRHTNFYCNSSSNHDKCLVEVHDSYLHLKYFSGGKHDTGCNNKSYSGESVAFGNAEKNEEEYNNCNC